MKNLMIKNRDGELEPINILKIHKKTYKATYGLSGTDQSELEFDTNFQLYNGISSEDIQKTLIMTAVQKIDIDKPNWTFVAARLLMEEMYHKVAKVLPSERGVPYPKFQDYLEYSSIIRTNKTFWKRFTAEELDILNDKIMSGIKDINGDKYHERDYQFNYLGIKTWSDRYALKNESGEIFELPQHMFMAIAMFLAQKEKDRLKWTLKFYDMISLFEVMLATPTLSNARKERSQLSSCFVGSAPDNIEGIFDTYKKMALLSKFGGGIGWDWASIRAMGSDIDSNKGVSGGSIPWLKITNDIAIAVDQLGTRKGSISVYLEPWHLDIMDFLDLKKNSGEERRRAHDLFPALWIPDLFMKRVQEDSTWTLFDPYDCPDLHELHTEEFEEKYIYYESLPNIRKETISAKELWKKIILSYFESSSPFLTFKDESNRRNSNDHIGIIRSSNLCLEIFQNTKPALYGICIEFTNGEKLVLKESEEVDIFIDNENSYKKSAKRVNNADSVILDNKVYDIDFVSRIVIEEGELAVCNLASTNLSKINKKEDFERIIPTAIRALDNVIDLNLYPVRDAKTTNKKSRAIGLGVMGEAQMLAEKGIMFGSKEHFLLIDEVMDNFSFSVIKASSDLAIEKGPYKDFEGSKWSKGILPIDTANKEALKIIDRVSSNDWVGLRQKVKENGIRNGYLMAIAPTSTISILTGTTQAIEPVFKRKWLEENLSGLIPVTAPNLNINTWSFYKTAYEVEQLDLIKAAAIRQKWLDQGQSLNVFVTLKKANGKYLNDIYMLAWDLGLKSTYYLRSESPEAEEEKNKGPIIDRSIECSGCQ